MAPILQGRSEEHNPEPPLQTIEEALQVLVSKVIHFRMRKTLTNAMAGRLINRRKLVIYIGGDMFCYTCEGANTLPEVGVGALQDRLRYIPPI